MNRFLQWILIIGFQIIVLNHLDISSYIYPQVFVVLLVILPLHLKKSYQILIAFGLGLIMDLFVYSPGIHMSACLWLIGFRMLLLSTQDLKEHINNKLSYSLMTVGLVPFFKTLLILLLFYHFYVLGLEGFGHIKLKQFIITGLSSSLLSLTIIGIFQALALKNKQ